MACTTRPLNQVKKCINKYQKNPRAKILSTFRLPADRRRIPSHDILLYKSEKRGKIIIFYDRVMARIIERRYRYVRKRPDTYLAGRISFRNEEEPITVQGILWPVGKLMITCKKNKISIEVL